MTTLLLQERRTSQAASSNSEMPVGRHSCGSFKWAIMPRSWGYYFFTSVKKTEQRWWRVFLDLAMSQLS